MATVERTAVEAWFLSHASLTGERSISNMKLNKLLYLAESAFEDLYGAPLIAERFKAWEHGPVVPATYHDFKEFGSNAIPPVAEVPNLPHEVEEVLETVWALFGASSASHLRRYTHDYGPYQLAYAPGQSETISAPGSGWSDFAQVGAALTYNGGLSEVERAQLTERINALVN